MEKRRFERILVCCDTAGKHVLSLAGRVAAANDAAVRLIACMPELPVYRRLAVPNYAELARLARDAREQQLNEAAARLSSRGVRADWAIANCAAGNSVLGELESQRYDLLMVAAQEYGTEYAASRSTIQLMRKASCPVWVVRPGHFGPTPKVLAAIANDGPDDLNVRLLLTADRLATQLEGELHVLSAWHAPGETIVQKRRFAFVHDAEIKRYIEDARDDCARWLLGFLDRSPVAIDRTRVHLIRGYPRTVIPPFCYDHAVAVLVMGTVARTGLVGALLGNTAEEISQSLPATLVSVGPVAVSTASAERVELAAAQGALVNPSLALRRKGIIE